MQMLMAVEVRDAQSCYQDALDLQPQLAFQVAAPRKEKALPVARHKGAPWRSLPVGRTNRAAYREDKRSRPTHWRTCAGQEAAWVSSVGLGNFGFFSGRNCCASGGMASHSSHCVAKLFCASARFFKSLPSTPFHVFQTGRRG